MDHSGHPDTENRWDPESAYRRERSSSVRLIAFILLVAAVGAVLLFWTQKKRANAGDVDLNASMSFAQADKKMQDAGYVSFGNPETFGNTTVQYYGTSPRVFGMGADVSALDVTDGNGGMVRICHFFTEDNSWTDQVFSMDNPGEVFRYMKQNLVGIYGEPEFVQESTGISYLCWARGGGSRVILGYLQDCMPALYYVYSR